MARRGRGPFHGSARHTPLPHSPVEPAAALTAIGAAIYGWDIGSGSLAWGPNAAEALGIPDIGIFTVASLRGSRESQGGAAAPTRSRHRRHPTKATVSPTARTMPCEPGPTA